MQNTVYNWKSFDDLKYFAQSWSNNNTPKAIICLVHGIGEHSSRYNDWAKRFVDNDIFVLAFDYRGHGKSEGKRGHINEYEDIMRDIDMLLSKSKELFPETPLFLYGHSLGGNFVLNYLLRRNVSLKGAIVTSPWLRLAFEPPAGKVKLGKFVKSVFPTFIQKTGLKTEHISRDKNVVDKYEEDKLVHDKISVKLFFDAYDSGIWALENADKLNTNLLLMHGDSDSITSPKASASFAEKSLNKSVYKNWEGAYHELHNEINNDEVFDFVNTWLNKELAK